VETVKVRHIEYGVAQYVLAGQTESGDHYLIADGENGILIAAVDGVGHGEEAALAAKAAVSILRGDISKPVISLVQMCHDGLRSTRGVVLSLASIDTLHGMMTWIGVGNVQGILLRARASDDAAKEILLLRAGVVGSRLPPLQASVVPIEKGDTLVFATDGIRGDFIGSLSRFEPPQRAADRILEIHGRGNDDALVLAGRFTGTSP
jgi:negative regulator of sigma-B (phosphoserine phosphatase)